MLDIVRVSGPPVRSCSKGGKVSAFDLVIRGGPVVDGNGGPPRTADVGIIGRVISDVGPGLGRGRREVGADGTLVTPGFPDIHTHYHWPAPGWTRERSGSPRRGRLTSSW